MKTGLTLIFIIPLIVFTGCQKDESPVITKHEPPVITSLSPDQDTIKSNEFTTITCSAYDPGGSTLTYVWAASSGRIISDTSSSVVWLAIVSPGIYQISCTVVANSNGSQSTETINLQVTNSSTQIRDYSFLVNTRDGIIHVDSSGKADNFIIEPDAFFGIEVHNNSLFVLLWWEQLLEYDRTRNIINRIPIPERCRGYFTTIHDSKFAFYDNWNDSIYFINSIGNHLKTVGMLTERNILNQNVNGIVVDNSLIVSENGENKILKVDLDSYEVSVFKDLSNLFGWLGAIDYSDGIYYICQFNKIWGFIKALDNSLFLITKLPEGSITSLVVINNYAYATVYKGRIYKISISTGEYEIFAHGLNYPEDMEVWRIKE